MTKDQEIEYLKRAATLYRQSAVSKHLWEGDPFELVRRADELIEEMNDVKLKGSN